MTTPKAHETLPVRASTPFIEDQAITQVAEAAGLEVLRMRPITISDRKALEEQGLMRKSPDYPRIRALLNDGVEVRGAAFGPIEYTLRQGHVKENDLDTNQGEKL